jgi:Domain of unknown function (DUF5076)
MARGTKEPQVYRALALPEQALSNGGVEILRLGIIDDELYVSALPAFKTPAPWGEVLAEVTKRLGAIYAAQKTGLSKKDVTVQIADAYATEMGASPVKAEAKSKSKPTKSKRAAKPAARRKKR